MNTYDADCFACAAIHTRDHICSLHALAPEMWELLSQLNQCFDEYEQGVDKTLADILWTHNFGARIHALLRKTEEKKEQP